VEADGGQLQSRMEQNLIRAMKVHQRGIFSLSHCAIDIIRLENLIKGGQSNASVLCEQKRPHVDSVIHENPHPTERPSRRLLEEQLKRPKLIS
jgi:hypothetical protein